jgi:6-pyruvoyltetrahydropterin/6-carboxytetrahydropterin synthase
MFRSTKILELGSCAFRQPKASHSHCRFIHGYKLSAKFWFEADTLDQNHWVVDFGGLKGLKKILREQFDHTTCIAADDPAMDVFEQLVRADACDLRVMPNGTGIERIAEWCHEAANTYVNEITDGRCQCIKVEVFEHETNSAIYEDRGSTKSGAVYMTDKADEIEKSVNQMKRSRQDKLEFPAAEEESGSAIDTDIPSTNPVVRDASISSNDGKLTNTWVDPKHKKTTNSWLF